MRLTKKKALQITADLWAWLEKNPTASKIWWPEWEIHGGSIPAMRADCPCCEYTQDRNEETDCNKCPLLSLWPNETDYPCLDNEKTDYFHKWCYGKSPKTKKKYARIIKEGALKELSCFNAN